MTLDDIYAKLPTIECKGKCQECCGPIIMSGLESQRIQGATGLPLAIIDTETLRCPYLTDEGKCSVYDNRPMICRLWGLTPKMQCPHGCRPSRPFSEMEAFALVDEVSRLDPTVCDTIPLDMKEEVLHAAGFCDRR